MGRAVNELKLVTVPEITREWDPRISAYELFVRNEATSQSRSTCSVCLMYADVPFPRCKFCGEDPCFHHGRCCPERPTKKRANIGGDERNVLGHS
jgi:hypothetical protein